MGGPTPCVLLADGDRHGGRGRLPRWRLRLALDLRTVAARYQNRVMPAAGDAGAEIRFTASLSGPLGSILERIVRPLSARGQRNRMTRLAEMAEAAESGEAASGR